MVLDTQGKGTKCSLWYFFLQCLCFVMVRCNECFTRVAEQNQFLHCITGTQSIFISLFFIFFTKCLFYYMLGVEIVSLKRRPYFWQSVPMFSFPSWAPGWVSPMGLYHATSFTGELIFYLFFLRGPNCCIIPLLAISFVYLCINRKLWKYFMCWGSCKQVAEPRLT